MPKYECFFFIKENGYCLVSSLPIIIGNNFDEKIETTRTDNIVNIYFEPPVTSSEFVKDEQICIENRAN